MQRPGTACTTRGVAGSRRTGLLGFASLAALALTLQLELASHGRAQVGGRPAPGAQDASCAPAWRRCRCPTLPHPARLTASQLIKLPLPPQRVPKVVEQTARHCLPQAKPSHTGRRADGPPGHHTGACWPATSREKKDAGLHRETCSSLGLGREDRRHQSRR